MSKRPRRKHSDEFKREAVKLVTEQGMPLAQAARNLDVNENLLRTWKQKSAAQQQASVTGDERLELSRLREENRRLRMERDMNGTAGEFSAISAAANLAGMAALVFVMHAGEKSNRGVAGLHGSLSFSLAGPFLEGCVR